MYLEEGCSDLSLEVTLQEIRRKVNAGNTLEHNRKFLTKVRKVAFFIHGRAVDFAVHSGRLLSKFFWRAWLQKVEEFQ